MDRETDQLSQATKLIERFLGYGRNESAALAVELNAAERAELLESSGGPDDEVRETIRGILHAAKERRADSAEQEKLARNAASDADESDADDADSQPSTPQPSTNEPSTPQPATTEPSTAQPASLAELTKAELIEFAGNQIPPIEVNANARVADVRQAIADELARRAQV